MAAETTLTETQLQTFRTYKDALRGKYGPAAYDSWFKPLSLVRYHKDHVVIGAPSNFTASQIRQRYSDGLVEVWKDNIGPIAQISIKGNLDVQAHASTRERMARQKETMLRNTGVTQTAKIPAVAPETRKEAPEETGTVSITASHLTRAFTFGRFCPGDANRIALAAASNMVETGDDHLLFVHGGSGRGKTHLLNAVGHAWLQNRPGDNVLYITYDNLLNGYVSAVMSKSVPELRAWLDRIDILIVDDIHLLRGRKATQEELLCLVDRLMSRGKTVAIAGGLAPAKLAETGLNQRFADRLSGGLCVQIDRPDYQLRLKILKQLADEDLERGKITLEEPMLQIIARHCDASVRELEGAYKLVRLHAEAEGQDNPGRNLSEDQIRSLLQNHLSYRRKEVTLDDIKSAVADEFGLTVAEIESRRRMQPIVKARHAFCLLARRLTDAPLKQVGAVINRDHTTVLSSIDRGEVLAETDPAFGDRISRLLEQFGNG